MKTYQVNDIFYSLQGEGVRAGTPNVFVRFSGCNLACDLAPGERSPGGFRCDTEFVSGRRLTAEHILAACRHLSPDCGWCILTGGEPGLQLDAELVDTLRLGGLQLAIETNGTVDVTPFALEWVCVSPKVAEHALVQRTADEVKYVRNHGQGIPRSQVAAAHYLLSPAFDGDTVSPATLAWCIQLCKENPPWRLSIQLHKWLSLR